ncbi:MAG: hypothetical protein AAF810_05385 [Cyanobacteria bacterium P01_D01_bin.36]
MPKTKEYNYNDYQKAKLIDFTENLLSNSGFVSCIMSIDSKPEFVGKMAAFTAKAAVDTLTEFHGMYGKQIQNE